MSIVPVNFWTRSGRLLDSITFGCATSWLCSSGSLDSTFIEFGVYGTGSSLAFFRSDPDEKTEHQDESDASSVPEYPSSGKLALISLGLALETFVVSIPLL